MKKILLFLLLVSPVLAIAQSQDENYILNRTYTEPSTTPNEEGISTITYYDGIGRPKQVINVKAGGWQQHQFTPIVYDGYGRQTKQYLPYAIMQKLYLPLDYMPNDNLINLINNKYSSEISTITPNPYSETVLENSPLSRPLEQGAPGTSWLADPTSDNDHTIKYEYDVNKNKEVRRFFVSFPTTNTTEVTSLRTTSYYAASTLYKKVTKDENWTPSDGNNKTVEEFTDKQGRTVLKRTYNDGIPHDTHYVYDKYSNLTYVIPPLAADNVYSVQFFNDFQNVNFPWTHLAAVDGGLADAYDRTISEYDNSEILNLDLLSEYGGQGGFSITPDEEGNLILNVNITTSKPMAYRTGQLLKLDEYGSFKDKELGRLVGNGYEYYFLIQGNTLVVDGYGVVPSITQSFTGNMPLEYQKNYPWTKIFKGDTEVVRQYESDIASLPNSDILTTFTANPYNATGGMSVSLDQDDTVNLSINIYSDQALDLLQGAVLPLGFKRSIADRTLGTVTGSGYTYSLEIKNNTLYILGSGTLNHLTFGGSFGKVKTVINPSVVDGLCYIYNYDKRNRLIKKHIPGKGWETIVYDKLNRPVFTQDEKLRAASGGAPNWLFTKYDKFGRVIYTGEFYDNRSRETLQGYINGLAGDVQHESYQYPGFLHNGITVDYTNDIFPTTGNILTVTNYDTYKITYEGIANNPPQNYYGKALISKPVGLVTATKVKALGVNKWITTILGYDEKGRQIWSSSKNAALLSELVTHQNLNFSGLAVATKTEHTKEATGFTITVEDSFNYDNMNRLEEHRKKINNNPEEMIVHNFYDELGRLQNKKVGGLYDSNTNYDFSGGLQTVDYKYNIRGWLTAINNVQDNLASSSIDDLFAIRLDYDTKTYASTTALYNGNIAEISWKTKNDGKLRTYGFTYDDLNRLTSADVLSSNTYTSSPSTGQPENYKEGPIGYDKNGNILSLERWGLDSNNHTDKIDILTYSYIPDTNQLLKVTDATFDSNGFDNGTTNSNDDYEYDENGNMTSDKNKGIGMVTAEKITYNHLNLPKKITFDQTHYIEYDYDATGIKLQKIVTDGSNVTFTHYDYGFIYQNEVLQYFPHNEGYIERQSNENYSYIYQYKDHLGNTRLSYKQNSSGGLDIIEEDNYYPFGMKHTGYNNAATSTNIGQKIKYGGKELQNELNLNYYDFGARNYDPALARWFGVDSKSEKFYPVSPYAYTINNPIYFVDPDGNEIIINGVSYQYKANRNYNNYTQGFERDTYMALDYLYNSGAMNITVGSGKNKKTVNAMDALIGDKKNKLTIEEGTYSNAHNFLANKKNSNDAKILFKGDVATAFVKNANAPYVASNIGFNSPAGNLAHEILHGYSFFNDSSYQKRRNKKLPAGQIMYNDGSGKGLMDFSFPDEEELYNTTLTNQVLSKLGEDTRTNYGILQIFTPKSPTSTQQ